MRRETFSLYSYREALRRAAGDLLDVEVPGVVLVMGDVDPVVVCDHPLVQAQDRLVTRLIGNIFGKQKIFLKVSPSP